MKQNQSNLTYFTIGEVFQCFLKKSNSDNLPSEDHSLIEEADIVNFVLQEMVNQNIAETTETNKLQLDYAGLYSILDLMEIIGFIHRKKDTTCSQRFLTWRGLGNVLRKYSGIFGQQPFQNIQQLVKTREYCDSTYMDKFVQQLLFRVYRNENKVILKQEVKDLKQALLFNNTSPKEQDVRAKLGSSLEKILVYSGLMEKTVSVIDSNQQAMNHQLTGLKWVFETSKLDSQFKESDYFKDIKSNFKIGFKREPDRQVTQAFENSGFGMFKGRNWRFFMQKLYCVIGRSPVNYKKKSKQLGLKVIWHVDVDLGHLRKVSRQHALIIYNFESQCFEIKCLSRKYPVYVNRVPLHFNQPARPLHSGAIIAISSESFFFMLPPSFLGQGAK